MAPKPARFVFAVGMASTILAAMTWALAAPSSLYPIYQPQLCFCTKRMRELVLLFSLLGLVLTAKLAPGVGRLLGHEKSPVAYNGGAKCHGAPCPLRRDKLQPVAASPG